ncbi:MAG: UpxY family transcription antiterminator [Prevotella sp.]|nr:UpxY family transcription antiterminator [Prevotella sp.]
MSTLTNVDIKAQRAENKRNERISAAMKGISTIPKAASSKTGVSVEYAHDPNKNWYVVRASYGRERRAHDYIVEDGTYTYLPMHLVYKVKDEKRIRTEEVLVPNILFIYATREKADEYVKATAQLDYLTYYYDHFNTDNGKNPPLVVPGNEMYNFMLATCTDSEHVRMVSADQCHFKRGDTVRVIGGPFIGVEGRVARVAGQQRVIVTINGLCSVATAYVPTAFLETIN